MDSRNYIFFWPKQLSNYFPSAFCFTSHLNFRAFKNPKLEHIITRTRIGIFFMISWCIFHWKYIFVSQYVLRNMVFSLTLWHDLISSIYVSKLSSHSLDCLGVYCGITGSTKFNVWFTMLCIAYGCGFCILPMQLKTIHPSELIIGPYMFCFNIYNIPKLKLYDSSISWISEKYCEIKEQISRLLGWRNLYYIFFLWCLFHPLQLPCLVRLSSRTSSHPTIL